MRQVRIRLANGDRVVFRSRRQDGSGLRTEGAPGDGDAGSRPDDVSGPEMTDRAVTAIERAYSEMITGGEAELVRFYQLLAGSDLLVLLDASDGNEVPEPKVIPVEAGHYVLVFDLKERVTELTGYDAPTSRVTGREVFQLMRGRGIGVAVNMGEAPSAMLIPADAIDWICDTLDAAADKPAGPPPAPAAGRFKALLAPHNFPDTLQLALNDRLGPVADLFDKALLLRAEYDDGQSGYLVAFSAVEEGSRGVIAACVNDALATFRGKDVALDIAFMARDEPLLDRIGRVATHLRAEGGKRPGGGPSNRLSAPNAGTPRPLRLK